MLSQVLRSGLVRPVPATATSLLLLSRGLHPHCKGCIAQQASSNAFGPISNLSTVAMGLPDGVYSMGPNTLHIDRKQFHGPIRQNVVKRMHEQLQENQRGIAVLQVRFDGRQLAAGQQSVLDR